MADGYTQVANALADALTAEFAPENMRVVHDRLHESIGAEGARIGISPERESPRGGNQLVSDLELFIQFYARYRIEVDPNQTVDPRKITALAERFKKVIAGFTVRSNEVWDLNLLNLSYPSDPTGNKTRFEARILAYGSNTASPLVETSG